MPLDPIDTRTYCQCYNPEVRKFSDRAGSWCDLCGWAIQSATQPDDTIVRTEKKTLVVDKPIRVGVISGLEIAKQFHESYERLAPSFGYETRKDTKAFDAHSPNGKLMTAVCQEVGDKIDKSSFDAGFQAGLREARCVK